MPDRFLPVTGALGLGLFLPQGCKDRVPPPLRFYGVIPGCSSSDGSYRSSVQSAFITVARVLFLYFLLQKLRDFLEAQTVNVIGLFHTIFLKDDNIADGHGMAAEVVGMGDIKLFKEAVQDLLCRFSTFCTVKASLIDCRICVGDDIFSI